MTVPRCDCGACPDCVWYERRPLTVAELIELLQEYPPTAVVVPELTESVIDRVGVALADFGPANSWDVPLDGIDFAPRLTAAGHRDGLIVYLTVEES